jgi:hypothetical protein
MHDDRRAFHRILYPLDEQPVLHLAGVAYRIRDCSERGLSFFRSGADDFWPEVPLIGRIEFRVGESVEVSGRVVRTFADVVAVELTGRGIPRTVIAAEQRRLSA